MKIKSWLLASFFIVMLLPVCVLYFLYVLLTAYDEKQDIKEFIEVTNQLSQLEIVLQNPSLYKLQPVKNYSTVQKAIDETMIVTLYRADGVKLFSSSNDPRGNYIKVSRNDLLKDLNEIQKRHRTFLIKKPVFQDDLLIGIYELTIRREEWIEGVEKRSLLLLGSFSLFFILLYLVVLMLLNRKLHRPLVQLQKQMTAFAKGDPIIDIPYSKKDEIGTLITHFNKMRKQIEKTKEEAKNHQKEKEYIVAALSHDLKTPLTAIRAYTEVLQGKMHMSQAEKQEYTKILFTKIDYMKQMLDDLVMYTALQSSHHEVNFVEVDGEEFFDMLLPSYKDQCEQRGISLTVSQCVKGTYYIDAKQMIRIVDNLMANAIRHTERGNHIWIGIISSQSKLPDWVFLPFQTSINEWRSNGTVLIIQNEGKAIAKENQKRIFEPFVQVEEARTKSGGSGLGLSIAKMLVEQQQGKIALWSTPKFGTVFACLLKERKDKGNGNKKHPT
ncbi:HAMP domain-containing histidine kinase [Bacillus aquiflavi]|uniref:histidine kinase n=1 Tax=Bacillus aquiflavi TaxID=2672567 RepID=A0A6B3VY97_9BACI|nr:HAMP domain-containing sensor histidine kinase [Bacillus aquiflavi]MBA4536132.1 HAMP domain-containing histidine kinase [Bacillus aquiflavi]NEY80506.1 HAMP domain-containing histidine kinase [Bacillus aquiflavi]